MEKEFWLGVWAENKIGFHESAAHPLLAKYFDLMSLTQGDRVFLPLCGKTLDISWLLGQGLRVVGAELSETAIRQLFDELGVEPVVSNSGDLVLYSADGIDMFVGDMFSLSVDQLGPVDAVYDRGALVALPDAMRKKYTAHLMTITRSSPQWLICFDYDQNVIDGPPFSISDHEVHAHYDDTYNLALLETVDVAGGLKGQCDAKEKIWLLNT